MKTIKVAVSAAIYGEYREYARRHGRTVAEIVRQALEDFRSRSILQRTSLGDLRPTTVGRVLVPFTGSEDLLEELSPGQCE